MIYCRNPTPIGQPVNFRPIDANQTEILDMTNNGPIIKINPFNQNIRFWNDLLEQYKKLWRDKHREKFSFNVLAVKIPIGVIIVFLLAVLIGKVARNITKRPKKSVDLHKTRRGQLD